MASESKSSTVVSSEETQDSGKGTNIHDPACRIVVVSPSLDVGVAFVERIKGFSSQSSSPKASASTATIKTPTQETSLSLTAPRTAQEQEQPLLIPHVLSNKYYTAPVHFAVCLAGTTGALRKAIPSSSSAPIARPPAIVFVWSGSVVDGSGKKYNYKKHAEELARQIQTAAGWEPEVVLGVRLPSLLGDKANEDEGDEDDENAEIDNALMQLGFEYVDISDDVGVGSTEKGEDDDDELEIPGLPRVLDALSTIMWPSMTPQEKGKGKILTFEDKARQEAERDGIMHELLISVSDMSEFGRTAQEGAKASTEDAFFSPYDFGRRSTSSGGVLPKPTRTEGGKSSKPWLDTSSSSHLTSPRDGSMLDSPGEMAGELSPFGVGDGRLGKKVSMRFEDDFAEFISAPVVVADQDEAKGKTTGSNTSTNATGKRRGLGMEHVDLDLNLSQAGFEEGEMETPLQTAIAESVVTGDSLGLGFGLASGKSLGGEEQGQRLGVPSKSRYASLGSVSDFGDADGDAGAYEELGEEEEEEWEDAVEEVDHSGWEDEEDIEDDDDLGLLPSKEEIEETAERIFGRGGSSSNMEGFRRASEEDRDFDLEDVLHSLRDLKSEIAGMDNEEEKHKLAAKVALGLVYGIK
ncbi:hypothetical protein D9613_006136 [Agrocybe pediades]|uniref:Uncharacterized protein n=1 Tax=Agrocybe pediades TaxID=84607 RepID=A0A8H4QUA5_9AGAR|nr:hypothetical protein D9613_006136 [Agrocybe pediades]